MKRPLLAIAALIAGLAPALSQTSAVPSVTDRDRLIFAGQPAARRVDIRDTEVTRDILDDKLTVVSFVSTGCAILCVTRTMEIDRLARTLPAALRGRVVFLAIETDPAGDDRQRLRSFGEDLLGRDAPLRILPSNAEGTKALLATLNYPASALPEPPAMVMLFDRRGRIAMSYGGDPLDVPRLQRDLGVLDTFVQGLGSSPTGAADTPRAPL